MIFTLIHTIPHVALTGWRESTVPHLYSLIPVRSRDARPPGKPEGRRQIWGPRLVVPAGQGARSHGLR